MPSSSGAFLATFFRYLFFQIPGWAVTAVVALALVHWQFIPKWLGLLGFLALVLKDLVAFPFLRPAYEARVKCGSAALVGKKGIAQGDLAPEGYIKIHLELWRAVSEPSGQVIAAGTEVEVIRAEGMKVIVRAAR